MRKYTILVFLLLLPLSASSERLFNCMDLVGTWQSGNFEYSIESQKTFETTFYEDNTFQIIFNLESSTSTKTQVESGKWECDGKFVTMRTRKVGDSSVKYAETYRLIELNSTYRKYQLINLGSVDCENIIGDCETKIYEGTKKL